MLAPQPDYGTFADMCSKGRMSRGAHCEDLAAVIARVEGLIDQVPRQNGGIILVKAPCDCVVAQHNCFHILLEPSPVFTLLLLRTFNKPCTEAYNTMPMESLKASRAVTSVPSSTSHKVLECSPMLE